LECSSNTIGWNCPRKELLTYRKSGLWRTRSSLPMGAYLGLRPVWALRVRSLRRVRLSLPLLGGPTNIREAASVGGLFILKQLQNTHVLVLS